MVIHPFPNAFGLDINDLSMKVVQLENRTGLRKTPRFELVQARETRLPKGIIVNGELEQPEAVRKYLAHLLKGANKKQAITSPWVVIAVPESQTFLKLITIDKPIEDIIQDDILIGAERHIPFEKNDYYLDWQVVPRVTESNNQTRVLVGAVPKKLADSYTYLMESLGLGVIALDIEALAIARAMITYAKNYEGEARAILDLGAIRSTLIVYDHGVVQFSMTFPYSGELINTLLVQKLHIDYETAEQQKIATGLNYTKKQSALWTVLMESVDALVEHITRAMQFYTSHFPETNPITHITMTGGLSNMQMLDQILTQKLGIESQPGHPWKNLGTKKPIVLGDEIGRGYATAIGLALRAAEHPFTSDDVV